MPWGETSWGPGCCLGRRRQAGRGRGAGDRGGELQRQPGLSCEVLRNRGAFAGSFGVRDSSARKAGKKKSLKGKGSCLPWARILPPSRLLAFLFSLGEFWGGSFLACFAAHKTFPGLEAMAGEATSFSPPHTHINAVYLHFASHRRRKLAFSLCRDESIAQTHT